MSGLITKIVGKCPFCSRGDEDKRYVLKILREGKSEYSCGIGKECIITKLYHFIDELNGNKNSEIFY